MMATDHTRNDSAIPEQGTPIELTYTTVKGNDGAKRAEVESGEAWMADGYIFITLFLRDTDRKVRDRMCVEAIADPEDFTIEHTTLYGYTPLSMDPREHGRRIGRDVSITRD